MWMALFEVTGEFCIFFSLGPVYMLEVHGMIEMFSIFDHLSWFFISKLKEGKIWDQNESMTLVIYRRSQESRKEDFTVYMHCSKQQQLKIFFQHINIPPPPLSPSQIHPQKPFTTTDKTIYI